MPNVVLYRKYRPQNFREIIGQEHIVKTLQNALKIGRISHAYLFTGPRGTGKTTIARILAKAVNCENVENGEPCNKCEACIAITEGRAMDLIEIDAASNRGIDEIRELREGVKFVPTSLKYKIYIIDEVHMLTKEAFNALLKTLEEPPSHVIFILATTEFYKLPKTIISRCQVFNFKKLSKEEIIRRIEWIKNLEKFEIDREAAEMIANEARGSLRDAESILEGLLAFSKNSIKIEDAKKNLGLISWDLSAEFFDKLVQKDISGIFEMLDKLVNNGVDINQFIKSLIHHLRIIFYIKIDESLLKYFSVSSDELALLKKIAEKLNEEKIKKMIDILFEAMEKNKISPISQLPLEMAATEMIELI